MKKFLAVFAVSVVVIVSIAAYLVYNGYLWFNNPGIKEFPVRGIDVSNHQGVINWEGIKEQGFSFVYIKATEGKDYRDRYFKDNWENSKKVGLKRGAYHFFTFGSTGLDQAKNFTGAVPSEGENLPPVIDIEFGGNSTIIPEKEHFQSELKVFIDKIRNNYNQKPIMYVTYEAYGKYLQGDFKDYKIWIRDILKFPKLQDNREWTIWQYSNRGRIAGIDGFVDLNVFNGSGEGFERFILKSERH